VTSSFWLHFPGVVPTSKLAPIRGVRGREEGERGEEGEGKGKGQREGGMEVRREISSSEFKV